MGFADHPYCVVLQKHDPDSTDSAQESAYADEVLVLALTHPQDDGKIIRGKLMINGDAKRLARALRRLTSAMRFVARFVMRLMRATNTSRAFSPACSGGRRMPDG